MPVTVYPSRTGNAPDDADRVHLAIVNPDHINYNSSQLQKDLLDLYQHSPGNAGPSAAGTPEQCHLPHGRARARLGSERRRGTKDGRPKT